MEREALRDLPLILETPKKGKGKGKGADEFDRRNLTLLRGLARRETPVPPARKSGAKEARP